MLLTCDLKTSNVIQGYRGKYRNGLLTLVSRVRILPGPPHQAAVSAALQAFLLIRPVSDGGQFVPAFETVSAS